MASFFGLGSSAASGDLPADLEAAYLEKAIHVIQDYGHFLLQFNHSKAKDVVDREREQRKAKSWTHWSTFYSILGQLALSERQYASLGFLVPKGFLHKNTLKNIYESYHCDLKKLEASIQKEEDFLTILVSQLDSFVVVRGKLMNLYETLVLIGSSAKVLSLDKLMSEVDHINVVFEDILPHEAYDFLRNFYQLEVSIITGLIHGLDHVANLRFLPGVECRGRMKNAQLEWDEYLKAGQDHKKIGFASSLLKSGQEEPLLFQWFCRSRELLVAKSNLYFYEMAIASVPAFDVASDIKSTVDFLAMTRHLAKRFNVHCVTYICDATAVSDFHGLAIFGSPASRVVGLDRYPALFSVPEKPKELWPALVALVNNHAAELNDHGDVLAHFDAELNLTLGLVKTDPHVTLVVVQADDRTPLDPGLIGGMQELAQAVRWVRHLAQLKPGGK
eukprot:maker-scaffold645_size120276-snap-gene-0.24 protein:Tk11117 transcript:maker-scaffold645_size120276-snap-gene-0.24-mRNA-1 annotation:"hypothetical protein L798_08986"